MTAQQDGSKKNWDGFWCAYVENGICDPDRRKTIRALKMLSHKLPKGDRERIPQCTVFAPSHDTLGLVHPFYPPIDPKAALIVVYLSPRLESLTQSRVDRVVAHEFAHAILGHADDGETFPTDAAPKYCRDFPSEISADELIGTWGYAPATVSRKQIRDKKVGGEL